MKGETTRAIKGLAVLGFCLLAAGTSWGALTELYLRAGVITNTMPDGRPVVMWGFTRDSGPAVPDGAITVPGPAIALASGSQDLLIHLKNRLPEASSVVIPGLAPVVLGDPVRNPDGRARAFTHEAAPGGTADYQWNNVPAGTYLYHSGSHPGVQVQMGLYGALTKLEAGDPLVLGVKTSYPGVMAHDSELTVVFSAVDPALHAAVATGNYGPGQAVSSPLHYEPKYFFINGRSYTAGLETNTPLHLFAGGTWPDGSAPNVLMRFLNADIDYHVPVLNGFHLTYIAEDGKPYPGPRRLNAPMLSPLKTMDGFFNAGTGGVFPLYDRRLGLVNGTNSPGGMLTYIDVTNTPVSLPLAPSALTATPSAPGPSQPTVALGWADNSSNETGFIVQRDDGGGFLEVARVGAGVTSFLDTAVLPLSSYSYRVLAYNAAGNSPPSNVAPAVTPDAPPVAASDLTATPSAPGVVPISVLLNWTDNSGNETGFIVERADGAGPFVELTRISTDVTAYVDMAVLPLSNYTYRVTAYNAIGNGLPSNLAQATTSGLAPNAPSTLIATPSAAGFAPISVALAWTDNSADETGFVIERQIGAGAFVQIARVVANVTSLTDTNVAANTTYTYRVMATNNLGNSAYATSAPVTTPTTAGPAAPSNVHVISTTVSTVTIGWNDNSNNELGFQIRRRSTPTATGGIVGTMAPDATQFTDTGRPSGTTYYYQVRSFNAYAVSAWIPTTPIPATTK